MVNNTHTHTLTCSSYFTKELIFELGRKGAQMNILMTVRVPLFVLFGASLLPLHFQSFIAYCVHSLPAGVIAYLLLAACLLPAFLLR